MSVDYKLLERQVRGLLDDERDRIANAANFAAFVFSEVPDLNWAGFYFAGEDGALVLGPFGGRPACSRLPAGKGVCQRAFRDGASVLVDDVSKIADHVYCDTASRSELVVPLLRDGGSGDHARATRVEAPRTGVDARATGVDRTNVTVANPIGVFDIDSPLVGRFTAADQAGIERLVAAFLDSTSI